MRIAEVRLETEQRAQDHGATSLRLELVVEPARLDLDDVRLLRDACDDVLEGRPLPR